MVNETRSSEDTSLEGRSTRLFMDAIVKGLVEHNDATRHFGSLLGFGYHRATAVAMKLITVESSVCSLTDAGRAYYSKRGLIALPDCRATFWTVHANFKG